MSGDQMQHGGEGIEETAGNARRDFLKKAGIAGAAAWTAPMILSNAASAQGTPPPILPIEFVGAGTEGAAGSGSSVDAGLPSGVQAGDLLVLAVTSNGASALTAPTGWTSRVEQDVSYGLTTSRMRVLTTTATGSEPSSITVTRGSGGLIQGQFRAVIVAYRNVSATTPLGTPATTTSGNGSTKTFPAVTSTLPDSWILRVGMHANGSATWNALPAGYAQRHESPSGDRGLIVFDSILPAAGSSGTVAVGLSASQSAVHTSMVINPQP